MSVEHESCSEEGVRADMVAAARQFMGTAKVRLTPLDEQRRFLRGKGVTDAEIEEALSTLSPEVSCSHGTGQDAMQQGGGLLRAANGVLVLSALSYAGYRLLRSVLLPRLLHIPDPALEQQRLLQLQMSELHNSIKFLIDSVHQTLQSVTQQQEHLNALLALHGKHTACTESQHVQDQLNTIKSLLLSHHQLPKPSGESLPSWQHPSNYQSPLHTEQHSENSEQP